MKEHSPESVGETGDLRQEEFYAPWLAEGRRPRVVVLAHPGKPQVRHALEKLLPHLERDAVCLAVDQNSTYSFDEPKEDFVIVLGGDGSILQAARQMHRQQRPVLGINLGRLGFLAALSLDQFAEAWPGLCRQGFAISRHLMLESEVFQGGKRVAAQMGLNEAAILGGPPYTMLQIDLYVDRQIATTYCCDGLIIATPIGSTAHNLSAGGPILLKTLEAFVISPINPHTLTMRPVVDSADRQFELVVKAPPTSTSLVVDGRVVSAIARDARIFVRRSKHAFKLVHIPHRSEYDALREKLGWSGTSRVQETGKDA